MNTVASVRDILLFRGKHWKLKEKSSHGGHGDTEDFLAIDQSLDAGFKPCFTKIEKVAEPQVR